MSADPQTPSFVFQSRSMQQAVALARRYARSSASVLIAGESGTGKELVARLIHEASPRRESPFVAINCAALPGELIESELFGHEPGAFTGASARRIGRFEAAHQGTLFLDEVGELPLASQPKLLRVLEDHEVQRLGATRGRSVDVRVVAATNRALLAEVRAQRFREDLYHRLGVLTLRLPALRERREDIPSLVQHFVGLFGTEGDVRVRGVTAEVMRQLAAYDWPGNVRELRNVLRRACLLATDELISQIDVDESAPAGGADGPSTQGIARLSLREIERLAILQRLKLFDGNRTRAAEALGVTTRTLRNKLAEYRQRGDAA